MEPRFNTTYFYRFENTKNSDEEFNQIHKNLKLHLSYATSNANGLVNKNSLLEYRKECENIETVKYTIYSLNFTHLVFKIKTAILNSNNIVINISPNQVELEEAHKKAVSTLSPTQNELLFLNAINFDSECNLKFLLKDIAKYILLSNYGLIDFQTFKYSITKEKIQKSLLSFNEKLENSSISQPIIEKKEKEKRESCIIC